MSHVLIKFSSCQVFFFPMPLSLKIKAERELYQIYIQFIWKIFDIFAYTLRTKFATV